MNNKNGLYWASERLQKNKNLIIYIIINYKIIPYNYNIDYSDIIFYETLYNLEHNFNNFIKTNLNIDLILNNINYLSIINNYNKLLKFLSNNYKDYIINNYSNLKICELI